MTKEYTEYKKHKKEFYEILDCILNQYELNNYQNINQEASGIFLDFDSFIVIYNYLVYKTQNEEKKLFYFNTTNVYTNEDAEYTLHFEYEINKDEKIKFIKILLNNEFFIELNKTPLN